MQRRLFLRSVSGTLVPAYLSGCGNKEGTAPTPHSETPDAPPPEFAFVPAPGFHVKLTIDVPPRVKVGEPVRLRARRESIGDWHKVRYASLPPDSLVFAVPGPAIEAEVAANISWYTDPAHSMKGDSGLRSLALGMEREAIFESTGVVQVWAVTATPLRQKSNILKVEVAR